MHEINISKLTWIRHHAPAPDGRSENQMQLAPTSYAYAEIPVNGNVINITIDCASSRLRDSYNFVDRETYPSLKGGEFFTVPKYAPLVSESGELVDEFYEVPFDEIKFYGTHLEDGETVVIRPNEFNPKGTTYKRQVTVTDPIKYAGNVNIGTACESALFLWE